MTEGKQYFMTTTACNLMDLFIYLHIIQVCRCRFIYQT